MSQKLMCCNGHEEIPLRTFVKEEFQELKCPKCGDVHGIIHIPHNKFLTISGEGGKRKQICPICGISLQSE